ncbi:MAG: TatD family deoxyribonuclease [Gammaproteobacteria bacterium]|nr:MAG: TatD family deoxyribonuclease [Gammaproteobacteria bacterium]
MYSIFVDTHCHLDNPCFKDRRESIVENCIADKVKAIINPAITAANWNDVMGVSKTFATVKPALGLHPCFISEHTEDNLQQLNDLLTTNKQVIAIGEIGLDYYNSKENREQQLLYFIAQMELARNHDLPVIIHCRKAHEDMLNVVKKFQGCRGIIHAYSGSYEEAVKYLDLGYKLGFGGAAINPKAKKYRQLLRKIPPETIVLETDAPDMAPYFNSYPYNTPENLPRIAAELAAIAGIDTEELAEHCLKNSMFLLAESR